MDSSARLLCSRDSQARILEWAAISYSRGSSHPRDGIHISDVSCIGRSFFNISATHGEGHGDFTFTFHFHALEKEMAAHSSVLAWRVPGMGEPGGLPSRGCTESDTTEST